MSVQVQASVRRQLVLTVLAYVDRASSSHRASSGRALGVGFLRGLREGAGTRKVRAMKSCRRRHNCALHERPPQRKQLTSRVPAPSNATCCTWRLHRCCLAPVGFFPPTHCP